MDKRSPVNSSSWKSIQASANKTQLATDPEMCMFALTVSTAEPKNIKEAMADSAWIEAMQEELSSMSIMPDALILAKSTSGGIQFLRLHKECEMVDSSFRWSRNSLPHALCSNYKGHTISYKHQDSRIMKAQELKTKTSAQTLIYKIFLQRYQVYQGRLLASFQDDAKYEHVGQDTRSQGGKDDQDKQGKDLKISDIKTKSKDNDKGSRSKITKHEGTSLQRIQRPRPQDLNDKSNLINLMKECHNELTSGEIVSLKIY
ncbi:hypothetical protein Tco_0213481 [Tanacetum coccineum]